MEGDADAADAGAGSAAAGAQLAPMRSERALTRETIEAFVIAEDFQRQTPRVKASEPEAA